MDPNVIEKNNPVSFKHPNQQYLDTAKDMLMNALNEYKNSKEISDEDYSYFLRLITEAYFDRKVEYLLAQKLNNMGLYLSNAINFSLGGTFRRPPPKDIFTKVIYYRQKKGEVTHEQYTR